jgi:hypothetical protein
VVVVGEKEKGACLYACILARGTFTTGYDRTRIGYCTTYINSGVRGRIRIVLIQEYIACACSGRACSWRYLGRKLHPVKWRGPS